MQDERGGDLIDDAAVILPGMTRFIENLVRFLRGEALVPEVDRQAGQCAQLCGKSLRFSGAGALFAGEMQRIPHHDPGDAVAAGQPAKGAKVLAWIAFTFQGQHRLRGEAQLVGDGHADAFRSHIEGEVARQLIGVRHSVTQLQLKARCWNALPSYNIPKVANPEAPLARLNLLRIPLSSGWHAQREKK